MTLCWKSCPVPGLEFYEVSHTGLIRSIDRHVLRSDGRTVFFKGKVLKVAIDDCGYVRARIGHGPTKCTQKMHRLVAKAFIPNPENLPQVNHIDGNKQNNFVDNLEWINNSDNQIHAIATGLKVIKTGNEAPRFSGNVLAYNSVGDLVATLCGNIDMQNKGFDFRLVSACLNGKRKSHRKCTFVKVKEPA